MEDLQKIEAVLFLSARYLDQAEIHRVTSIEPENIPELISKLQEKHENSAIVIHAREHEGIIKYKMDIKQELHYLVNKLATGQSEFTKAEQETLAIIAYKQPIKQSLIVKIRGNKAYEHIKHFIELGLLKAKKLGRTKELSLKEEFYDYFSVKNENEKQNL
ncbi:MAG: SMC-Scp complex subunit ScpB [archaeon]